MPRNDRAARQARAARIRKQIEKLKSADAPSEPKQEDDSASRREQEKAGGRGGQVESPREFIHRRMAELDQEEGGNEDPPI